MKNEEIKKYVEDQIAYHCDEFGLIREEVEEVVLLNCIEYFYRDALSEKDLLKIAKYLNIEIDTELIKKEKTTRQRKNKK